MSIEKKMKVKNHYKTTENNPIYEECTTLSTSHSYRQSDFFAEI